MLIISVDIREQLGSFYRFTQPEDLGLLLYRVISVAIVLAGLLLLAFLVMAGIEWLTSGGEKNAVANAKNKITNAFIGLFIVLAAWALFSLIKYLFGLPSAPTAPPPQDVICDAEDLERYSQQDCEDACFIEKNCSGHCRTNKNEFGVTFCECVPGPGQRWSDPGYTRCEPI